MSPRRGASNGNGESHAGGFAGFLRSLLAGVPWSERAEGEDVLHLERPAGGAFRLHNANGRTRICGEDRDDIEVHAAKLARAESTEAAKRLLEQIRVVYAEVGDTLELDVEVPRKWNRRGHANLVVKMPRHLNVEVSAANGRIQIEGVRGSVRARSSNGSATINDVVGDIEVATSNAKVTCSCTCGRLFARSSNGKIEVNQHRGSIDASTSNGFIRACLEDVGKGGVQLCTSNGRIALELPPEVDADVDIRVDNGVIRNDRTLSSHVRQGSGRVRGRLGAGGALIKLRTSNGSISLR